MKSLIMCLAVFQSTVGVFSQSVHTTGVNKIFKARFTPFVANVFNASVVPMSAPDLSGIRGGLHAEKKYMLQELTTLTVAGGASFYGNDVSLLLMQFGNNEFAEKSVAISYAKYAGNLVAGIQFRYCKVRVSSITAAALMNVGASALVKVTNDVRLFIAIQNPHLNGRVKSRVYPASVYSFGVGWQVSPIVYTGLQIDKEQQRQLSITYALDYKFSHRYVFSITWAIVQNEPGISLSWEIGTLRIQAGASYHAALGASPFTTFVYDSRNNNSQL